MPPFTHPPYHHHSSSSVYYIKSSNRDICFFYKERETKKRISHSTRLTLWVFVMATTMYYVFKIRKKKSKFRRRKKELEIFNSFIGSLKKETLFRSLLGLYLSIESRKKKSQIEQRTDYI